MDEYFYTIENRNATVIDLYVGTAKQLGNFTRDEVNARHRDPDKRTQCPVIYPPLDK